MILELKSKDSELILMTHTHTQKQRHLFGAKKELDQLKIQNGNKLDKITNWINQCEKRSNHDGTET